MDSKRVAIIGSGTAGAASALYLSRDGHEVTLFEKVELPLAVGAGVMLQPSGMRVLQELGLEKEILQSGVRVKRLHATTQTGRTVLDLRYEQLDRKYFGLGLHRGALFQSLYGAVLSEGIETVFGVEVEQVEQSESDGCTLVASDGRCFCGYDFVVVASGARTALRKAVEIPHTVKEYAWGALWFVAENGEFESGDCLRQYLVGTHTMLGFLPTGQGPLGGASLTSVFWSIRADLVDDFRHHGLDHWKAGVLELAPKSKPILDQIQSIDQLLFAPYFDVVLKRPFKGSVIFLGDAAHATSPQLGQGCNLALVDAATLGAAVAGSETVAGAFEMYEQQRRSQIRYYQWATRFLTPFFQSNSRMLGWTRDTFMGLACSIPPISKLMISTMCGLQNGLLSSCKDKGNP
jgi:2-polyprenyl-6-methoxyphenol hydroxylase-like FAD-dependent oxidoreductase